MRRKLALLVASLLVAGGTGAASIIASSSATAAMTITVTEHAVTDHFTDLGKSDISPGDLLTFHNPIYDSADTTQVGTDQGSCIRITKFKENLTGSWECEWTTFLNDGADTITVESPYNDTGPWCRSDHRRHRCLRGGKRLARPQLLLRDPVHVHVHAVIANQ
jgi:hypothetical protein